MRRFSNGSLDALHIPSEGVVRAQDHGVDGSDGVSALRMHNGRLVLLAGLVCFVASIVAVNIFHRALGSQARTRLIWIAIAGAAIGYGIWATHFVAMLAYEPGVSTGYGITLTALSLAAAMILTSGGFGVAV